jgi:hypothetical protein
MFPGDRIMYPMLQAATFFDFILIIATGVQTGFLGMCIGFIVSRSSGGLREQR